MAAGLTSQAETFDGFISCSLQSKTSLLAWIATHASLSSSFGVWLSIQFQKDGASINLLTILVATGVLVVWAWASGGVYRNWGLDVLEGSFALNLIILTATTYYVKHSGGNQCAVGYTSVSIAVATFIGILVFQLASITCIAQYFKRNRAAVAFRNAHQAEAELEPPDIGSQPDRLINQEEHEPPSYTPQEHTIAEPAEGEELVCEAHRRVIPLYNYGSIN